MRTVTGNLPPPKTGEREKPKTTLQHYVDEVHKNDEEQPIFKMEVLRVFGGNALLSQVNEAVQIREESGQMNRQQEWSRSSYHTLACLGDIIGWGAQDKGRKQQRTAAHLQPAASLEEALRR